VVYLSVTIAQVHLMQSYLIKRAETDADIEKCFDVLLELRPHLNNETFLTTVQDMERQGFSLAYLEDASNVVAVAGYRVCVNLMLGKHLYIDDLVASTKVRSKGYGEKLYAWVKEEAKKANCAYIHLDSGTQRGETHRFYFRQGLVISAFHFWEKLDA
jgi:GNAT superfamily N-acetyltransferase